MHRVFATTDPFAAQRAATLLEEAGIRVRTTEESTVATLYLGGNERVVLWVPTKEDAARGQAILEKSLRDGSPQTRCGSCGYDLTGHAGPAECPECGMPVHAAGGAESTTPGATAPADGPDVPCPHCGEEVPPAWDRCWSCNRPMAG